jgi:hypothetical protein
MPKSGAITSSASPSPSTAPPLLVSVVVNAVSNHAPKINSSTALTIIKIKPTVLPPPSIAYLTFPCCVLRVTSPNTQHALRDLLFPGCVADDSAASTKAAATTATTAAASSPTAAEAAAAAPPAAAARTAGATGEGVARAAEQ